MRSFNRNIFLLSEQTHIPDENHQKKNFDYYNHHNPGTVSETMLTPETYRTLLEDLITAGHLPRVVSPKVRLDKDLFHSNRV